LGEYVQMVTICEDMGVQTGPACNPASIEQFTIPFIKRFTDFVHKNSDMKVFLHSCGSINPLIPMFIEAGVDILNPVQISAAEMDPQGLKDAYGDDIIFWGGGVDTQHVLGTQPTKKVEENVEELVNIFKRDGGYVFNPVHNIMGNVPPEDIVAMYDKAYENSFYRGAK
ncbi:MAG: methyltransferase, partial [Candidatus Hydrogenedentes bacterium]|nr:methyltransferase [Candidatus Hydrogenedentota bacterium]